jgi:hypothetical protein
MSLAILGIGLLGSCKKDDFSVQEKSITWIYDQPTDSYYADISDDRINDFVLSYGSVDVEIKDVSASKGSGYFGLPTSVNDNEIWFCYQKGNVHMGCLNPNAPTQNPISGLGLGTVKITVYKDLAAKRKSTPSFGKQKVKAIH